MKGLDDKINEIMKKSQVTTGKFVSNIISHGESILLDISHTITDNTMITGAIYVIRDGYNGNIVVPIDNQKVKTLNLSGSSGSDKYATVIGIGYDTPSNKIKLKNLSQLVGTTISIIYAVYEA